MIGGFTAMGTRKDTSRIFTAASALEELKVSTTPLSNSQITRKINDIFYDLASACVSPERDTRTGADRTWMQEIRDAEQQARARVFVNNLG